MLHKEDILRGLRKMDALAKEAGVVVDLSIYGGAAEVAAAEGWPQDWLNDGVKGFTSSHEKMHLMESFGASAIGGLRVYTPVPEYLFAMKCMAMRPEGIDGSHDISDIEALADEAAIEDAKAALLLVEAFYPAARIPPIVRLGVEEIMDRVVARRVADARGRAIGVDAFSGARSVGARCHRCRGGPVVAARGVSFVVACARRCCKLALARRVHCDLSGAGHPGIGATHTQHHAAPFVDHARPCARRPVEPVATGCIAWRQRANSGALCRHLV